MNDLLKYAKSPYVVLGILGIVYFLYTRKQIMSNLPEFQAKKQSNSFGHVPDTFKADVMKMSKSDIEKAIASNQDMLSRTKMEETERKGVELLISYLKDQYKKR
jgi:hypothetical protein